MSLKKKLYIGVILLSALTMGLFWGVTFWVMKTWSHLTMEELMYQLNAPMDGTNQEMIIEAVKYAAIPALAALLVTIVVVWVIKSRSDRIFWSMMTIMFTAFLGMIAVRGYAVWKRLDIAVYLENNKNLSEFIDTNYADPAKTSVRFPEEKRNLIYIFLESMEITYADESNGGAFKENCIPELTMLAQQNEDFSGNTQEINGAYDMPYTTWTIGAMFAHSSGLPLQLPFGGNSMSSQETFFSGIVTLGDLLEENGYSQTLLIGSDATFGGRRLLYTEHGAYDIKDYLYALDYGWLPIGYNEWWGYRDSKLFEFAKNELLQLSSQEEPFNLTILTADTHFEDGFVCDLCEDTFKEDQYANVMSCSSRQIKEFVEWIEQQDFYENTSIVLVGDHHTMDADFCKDIDGAYARKVYTAFLNSAVEVSNPALKREYTTFDLFPTTIASLGAEIENNQLGLGTNLFSDKPTLLEEYGYETLNMELSRKSKFMMENSVGFDVEKAKEQQENVVEASVRISEYDETNDKFMIYIDNISNKNKEIKNMRIAIWATPDQTDLQWVDGIKQGDLIYQAEVLGMKLNEKSGNMFIDVYVIDENEEMSLLQRQIIGLRKKTEN